LKLRIFVKAVTELTSLAVSNYQTISGFYS
jgi:hypothetical protein